MMNDELTAIKGLRMLAHKLYSQAAAAISFHAADNELQSLGVDTQTLEDEQTDIMPLQSGTVESPLLLKEHSGEHRCGAIVGQVVSGIKRLLSAVETQSFAAVHLGDTVATAKADVVRIISLADCPELSQQLPWLGGVLRIYQQEHRPNQSSTTYVAFIETREVAPSQQIGDLQLVLTADNGERSEIFLSFDFPSGEFPSPLPADENQLTLECYASNVP